MSTAEIAARFDAKRSGKGWKAVCPSHEDREPSLSIDEGRDGRTLIKCFAGCDKNDVLAAKGLTINDLFSANGSESSPRRTLPPTPFDWQRCVDAFTDRHVEQFAKWRGYPLSFCFWLREQKLVGLYQNSIAFPVHDLKWKVAGCHYRIKQTDRWEYTPKGEIKVTPLIVGPINGEVHLFESQWDAFALRGMFDKDAAPAVIATRGAGNSIPASIVPSGIAIYAWKQNDQPGEKWLAKILKTFPQARTPIVPSQFKDFNDWSRARLQGIDLMIAIKDSEPPAVSSEKLFNDIKNFLLRYIVFSQPEHADVIALWIFHTWMIDAADFTPYLYVHSPVMRCGKTQVQRVAEPLVRNPVRTCNVSEAVLFREIEQSRPTLLMDEMDSVFGTRKSAENAEGKRGLINAGYERGLTTQRMERIGDSFKKVSNDPFCPKILAGIGKLPDTIVDRAIPILIHRKLKTQTCSKFRRYDKAAGKPLHDALETWSKDAELLRTLREARPQMPESMNDRQEDIWEPLFAIANAIGGEVPKLCQAAALALCGSDEDDLGYGTTTLLAIKKVIGSKDRISSSDLIDGLWEDNALPSRLLDADDPNYKKIGHWLSKLIKSYGGQPAKKLRFDERALMGYEAADLKPIFDRYCPPE